MKEQTEV